MSRRIAMLGAGAVGGYVGGHFAHAGYDVTLIDFWHEHIEAIRRDGLELTGMTEAERLVVRPQTMLLHEVSGLAKQRPVDIAFISVKSYDTDWMTAMIRPYLAPAGFVVSLQNCLNEERIAQIVGWGRTMGAIAARIGVELYEPARIRRQEERGASTVFRVGELHGRETDRARELRDMFATIDGAKVTTNLWGERWSKLVRNSMRAGISAATTLGGRKIWQEEAGRHLSIRLGAEGVRVGQALGFELEKIGKTEAGLLGRALEDAAAFAEVDRQFIDETAGVGGGKKGALQRASMAQDMAKGRRTEIDYINGVIAEKGREVGVPAPTHEMLTDLVHRVERGEVPARPENLALLYGQAA